MLILLPQTQDVFKQYQFLWHFLGHTLTISVASLKVMIYEALVKSEDFVEVP